MSDETKEDNDYKEEEKDIFDSKKLDYINSNEIKIKNFDSSTSGNLDNNDSRYKIKSKTSYRNNKNSFKNRKFSTYKSDYDVFKDEFIHNININSNNFFVQDRIQNKIKESGPKRTETIKNNSKNESIKSSITISNSCFNSSSFFQVNFLI